MRKKTSPVILAGLLICAFGLTMAKVSARFPPVYPDEVIFSVHGYNFLTGQGHRYSLYDDIFDRSVYAIRDALPDITRIVYNTWDGLWLIGAGRAYRQARWSSVAAGVLALLVLYQIGRTLQGPGLGLAVCSLCAINPVMMFAASIVRPEILLMASVGLSLWLILRLPWTWPWKPFVIGVLVGLSTAIHWNAAAAGFGLWVTACEMDQSSKRLRHALLMAAGMAGGALVAFGGVNPEKFMLSLRTVNYLVSTPPPLLGDPFHPWHWIGQTLRTFFLGQTSFFNWTLVSGWRRLIALSWVGLIVSVMGGLWAQGSISPSRQWIKALGSGLMATLAAMFCLIKRQELTYAITLFPFLMPLAGELWTRGRPSPIHIAFRAATALCLGGSLVLYGFFAVHFVQRTPSFDHMTAEVHRLIPDVSLRLAGPPVLWFAWPAENFRDLGAVITSGWYTEGRKDVAGCLLPWKPDVLVVDAAFRHIVGGTQPMLPLFRRILPADVRYLGSISTALGPDQDWEVYRLSWTGGLIRNIPSSAAD